MQNRVKVSGKVRTETKVIAIMSELKAHCYLEF